jgi:hypothetical protein
MAFEEEFGVEIPDDQAETIVTVGDAVKYLEKASKKYQQDALRWRDQPLFYPNAGRASRPALIVSARPL